MYTKVATKRREFVAPFLSSKSKLLELGPFNNPTFRRESGEHVWYMDMFSKAELIEMHKGNVTRSADTIVETDFVVKERDFSSSIPMRFDLVAAHHVVEHVADLIFWFSECSALLEEGGRLFLSVPDRRYTFDYFRPVSLASQILRASEEKATKPQLWQVVEHFYYHQKVDLEQIWAGNPPRQFTPRFSLREAFQRATAREGRYTDTHCWVFTPESFVQVISDLRTSGYIGFDVETVQDTQRNTNEFRVILRKD